MVDSFFISNVHEISSYGVAIKDFKSSHTLVCCGLKFLCALYELISYTLLTLFSTPGKTIFP